MICRSVGLMQQKLLVLLFCTFILSLCQTHTLTHFLSLSVKHTHTHFLSLSVKHTHTSFLSPGFANIISLFADLPEATHAHISTQAKTCTCHHTHTFPLFFFHTHSRIHKIHLPSPSSCCSTTTSCCSSRSRAPRVGWLPAVVDDSSRERLEATTWKPIQDPNFVSEKVSVAENAIFRMDKPCSIIVVENT